MEDKILYKTLCALTDRYSNTKRFKPALVVITGTLLMFFVGANSLRAANITIMTSTNWSAITSGSGTGGLPGTGDAIIVQRGATLTVNVTDGVCASIQLGTNNMNSYGILSFNSGTQVTVSGTVTVGYSTTSSGRYGTISMSSNSSMTCNRLVMQGGGASTITQSSGSTITVNSTATINASRTTGNVAWNVNDATATVTGTLTLAATSSRYAEINITTGTFNANGGITFSGSSNTAYKLIDMTGGAGTLNVGGTGFTSPTYGTFSAGTSGSLVNYNYAGTQNVAGFTYQNLWISGSGTKTLAAAATVNAGLTVNAGATLALSNYALGSPTSITLECGASTGSIISGSGTLTLGGGVTVNDVNTGTSGATISVPVALGATRTFTVADDGTTAVDLTMSGIVSGSSYGVTKAGAGQLYLSAANTYTGAVTINEGTLVANTLANANSSSSLGTGAGTAAISIGAAGILQYTGSIGHSSSRAVILTGSGGSLDASGTGTMTLSGGVTGSTYGLILTGTGTGVLSGAIATTSGTLTKNGSGTWTVSGTNSYTGLTTIDAGIVKLGSTSALGTNAAGTVVSATDAALDLNGVTLSTSEALTLNGTGVSSGGALTNSSSTAATYNGQITIGSASSIGTTGNITLGSNGITGGLDLTKVGSGTLNLGSGTVTLGALTISSGTLTGTSGTMSLTGNITNNDSFTNSSGTVYLNGSTAQSIGGTASSTFYNLTLENAGGALLGIAQTVNGTLTLTSGRLTLGDYDLTLGVSSPAVSGTLSASNMIVAEGSGLLQKIVTANGSYLFPVGDVTGTAEYSPVTLTFASGTYSSAYAGVRVTNAKHPSNASSTNYLNRYWTVSSSGISSFSCTVTGTYVPADIAGSEGLQAAGKYGGTLPWTKYSTLASNTLTASGVTSFGAFTGITAAAPTVNITANPGLTIPANTSLTLTANPVGDPTITYSWSPDGEETQAITPSTTTAGSTEYTVVVTDGNGFTATSTVTVYVCAIQVTSTEGTSSQYYTNLKQVFDSINGGVHQGIIRVAIAGNTTETTTAVLNASGSGSASYSSVLVYPTATGITISGTVNGNFINLNGADNVCFDGRVNATGSTTDLTITNTSTGTSTVTLQLDNSAQNDTIQYCTIKGGGGAATNGTILFGTTGTNAGNIIDFCNITNNGTRRVNAIYAVTGTNTGNTVSNNNLYDNWSASATSYSINLNSGTSDWNISGNSFYETASYTPGAYSYYGIYISNTSGNNFTLSANYIGGSSALCSGTFTMGTAGSTLCPVYLSVGTSVVSSVQGNTIRNISYTSSGSTPFYGMYIANGAFNIGTTTANTIGDTTGTSSITLTGSATSPTSYGIYITSTGTVFVSNNNMGAITATNSTSSYAHSFCGIYKTSVAGNLTIHGNTIGSVGTSSSIRTASTATGYVQNLYGIYSQGTGTAVINGNTLANFTNTTSNTTTGTRGTVNGIVSTAGTDTIADNTIFNLTIANANNASDNTASVCGIALTGTTIKVVTGNTIYGLSNTYASFAGSVIGLYFTGGTTANTVSCNFIRTLSASYTSSSLYGIKINAGATTYSNNIISLTNTVASTIYGIYETGASGNNNNLYFNTVYIYGSLSSGTSKTYALYSAVSTNTRIFKNNLLCNVRSTTSGSNLHYAIYYAATGTQSTLTADYNDYIASGTGGVLGYYNSANKTTYVVVTGQDSHSMNTAPSFVNAGGSYLLATDFRTGLTLAGVSGTGITIDYLSNTRGSTPTIGAIDFFANVDVYSGSTLVASFMTLQLAFNAINNASSNCTGDLTLKLNASMTESTIATLNASGSGSASYTRVHIYPTANNVSISGSLSSALINLNGADNVCIDGRVNATGSTPDLVISNTNTGTSAVTIQFNTTAQTDTVMYCAVKGGGGSASNGTFLFGTSGTNTGNLIDHCTITNNGTRRVNGIYSVTGTNTGNTVSNNELYDTWSTAASSYFVNLAGGTSDWTISGNSFYETTSFQPSGTYTYAGIYLNNTSGVNHTVSGNYIGGQDTVCSGSALLLGTEGTVQSLVFYPIYVNSGTTTATSIQGNLIRNISYRSSNTAPFAGIYISAGVVNVGTLSGNFIGDSTGTGSVALASTVSVPVSYGIYLGSTSDLVASNNVIGSLTTTNTTTTYTHSFYGIYKPSQAGTATISNNFIGGDTTEYSIQTNSAASGNSQLLYGIYSAGTGTTIISGNTVANMYNATTETGYYSKTYGIYATAGTNIVQNNVIHDLTTGGAASGDNYDNVPMTGIHVYSISHAQKIMGNTVYNLTSTTSEKVEFYGILLWGSTSGNDTIAGNFIHSFKMVSVSTTCYLHGLSIYNSTTSFTGSITAYNNIIFLGDSITVGCYIFGIVKNTLKAVNIYHNTLHLGGTVADGSTTSSFAYRDKTDGTPQMRDIRNNVFYNTRSGGGSNYSIYLHVADSVTIDYNDYGWSGTYFAWINSESKQLVTLQEWLEAMDGQDTHSLTINPQFVKMDGVLATDYKTNLGLDGMPGLGITTDYGGLTRSNGNPTMGAWECFPVDIYNGTTFRSSYFTLKDAFDAINAGTWTSDLIVKMKGSTLETITAALNASGTGSANYSSVIVYPIRSDVIIKGNLNAPVVRLDGADNVTFDGRIDTSGVSADMTVSNLSTESSASTIQLNESAQNNTLRYCYLRGAETGTSSGVIHFSTASASTGNDGNTIRNCIITGTTEAERPVNAIYSSGTTGRENSGNTVTSNSIINNWSTESSSYSINLGIGSTNWTISGNSFYDTTAFVPEGAFTYSAIYLNDTSGVGHTISGNYFGGTLEQGLDSAMTIGSTAQASVFYPIYLKVGSAAASSIQGNLFSNMKVYSSATNPFTAIYVADGSVNIGTVSANQLGAVAGTGNVILTASATSALSYGMYLGGTGSVIVSNNNLGSITIANITAANAHSFYVMNGTGSGSIIISSNLIGSTSTTGSIQTSSTATGYAQGLRAVNYAGTGTILLKDNTISNLLNGSTYNSVGNHIYGFCQEGTGVDSVLQNYISNLATAATGTAVVVAGIYLNSGTTTCANNVLNLGSNSLGYHKLYGIYETGVNGFPNSNYHNTVYLSGTISGTSSAALTCAYYKLNNAGSSDIRNNIFFNARSSGSSSSRHYAVRLPGTTTVTIDGNDYYVTGTNKMLGCMGTTDVGTMTLWQAATSQDTLSLDSSPGLLNAGGTSALDYKTGSVLSGVPGTGILIDFSGSDRDTLSPTIGAWEYALCVEVYVLDIYKAAYTTLKETFDKINDGTWQGDLKIKILKSTYETETAALDASGSGPTYSRVLIYPYKTGITVAGSMNAPLVKLNGADAVIFDGRVNTTGSTPSLTFSNSSTGTSASTIQFAESAQLDTLQYCIIKGAGMGSSVGTVCFTTASAGTGNSNNLIRYCRITGQNSSERPINAIYSSGTAGRDNSNNTISNNYIYNFIAPSGSSNAIHINANSTAFTVTGNSFYGTATFTSTTANEYAIVRVNNTDGNGFVITNNYLGGSAPLCSGTWAKIGNNSVFYGIYLNVGTSTATSIQNNVIANISYTNTGNADMAGIHVAAGLVNIGTETGNIIGSATGTGSITVYNSTSGSSVYGINIEGSGTVSCRNNTIGSVTAANNTSAYATHFYGIYKAAVAGNVTISNNTIGSTSTASSVQASSNAYAASQVVYGIYCMGTGTNIISNNTVANLYNKTIETTMSSKINGIYVGAGSNTIQNNIIQDLTNGGAASGGSGTSAPSIGLYVASSTSGQVISDNIITRLTNTSTAKVYVYGMYYNGPTSGSNLIYENFINRMLLPSAPPESYVQGLTIIGGTGDVYNNIVAIGDSITKGLTIYGLVNNNTSAMTFYHNTVYVGGTVAAAISPTYAFRDETVASSGTRNIRNNLFSNHRSGGGTHYAIYLPGTTNLTIDYNDYYAGGTNGVLGYLSSNKTTLSAWKTATGQDANSLNTYPTLMSAGSTSPTDYTPTASLPGYAGLIAVDYTGTTRETPPTMGALEFIGYYWTGTIDNDWTKAGNWLPMFVPTIDVLANIPQRTNQPVVYYGDTARLKSMLIYTGAIVTIDAGGMMTVASSLVNNAGTSGLVINSTANGTGSFICPQDSVYATVYRYINGEMSLDSAAWHFLSSPVVTQTIHGTVWTPSGSYGDGTGYDLFVWDEPSSGWIYNLNDSTTDYTTWSEAHPQTFFVPGRGYLYSIYDSISTKPFAGYLSTGTVTYPLTISGSGSYQGLNLVGNPYPSSIDWKTDAGFDRSMLDATSGGYDIWTWSSTANNYGVYNSADTTDEGTNNVTRYVAPMQGFFVYATTAGSFEFNNDARVHNGANTWLKSAPAGCIGAVKLKVSSESGTGSDEIKLRFGYTSSDKGSPKLFSYISTAPSLYLPLHTRNYSIRVLTDTEDNPKTPVSFKAGADGYYSITCQYDPSITSTVYLQDKLTGDIHDFSLSDTYSFIASTDDATNRFVLHYGSITPEDVIDDADMYVNSGFLYIDLRDLNDEYKVSVYDLNGRIVFKTDMSGGEKEAISLKNRGMYLVTLRSETGTCTRKVVY